MSFGWVFHIQFYSQQSVRCHRDYFRILVVVDLLNQITAKEKYFLDPLLVGNQDKLGGYQMEFHQILKMLFSRCSSLSGLPDSVQSNVLAMARVRGWEVAGKKERSRSKSESWSESEGGGLRVRVRMREREREREKVTMFGGGESEVRV